MLAVGLIWFGANAANDSEAVGLEAAKAGFQLLVLAAVGVGITGVLERFSRQHEERRRVNDAAVELLRDLIDSYNKVKGTRRVLRALGLDQAQAPRANSAARRQALEREMRTLLEAQLTFERIGREIGVRLEGEDTARRTAPQTLLAGIESYVKTIVKEWEDGGESVASGEDDLEASVAAMPSLTAFLKHSRDDPDKRFRRNVSEPLREIETLFRRRLIVPISLGDEPYLNSAGPPNPSAG